MPNDNHSDTLKKHKWSLALLALVAILAGIGMAVILDKPAPRPSISLVNATLYPTDFRPIPDFTLIDTNSQPFTQDDFKNHWSFVFFGFTHCPDVCPTTLTILNQALQSISPEAQTQIRVILVSVDPERDTTDRLKAYVHYFNPDFIGLNGEPSQLQKLTKGIGVFFSKSNITEDGAQYQIDHSAGIFLINPKGRLHALLSAPHNAKEIVQDFTQLFQHYKSQ